jgi:hypothetical protein
MQKLTAMTFGALVLGFGAFVVDATAQPPAHPVPQSAARCDAHEVAVYFSKGSAELNEYGQALVKGMAEDARVCGAGSVTVQAVSSPAHANAVARELKAEGIEPVILRIPALVPVADTMAARSVVLRVGPPAATVG